MKPQIESIPMTWHPICPVSDIIPNTGVAALVNGHQVAVFRIKDRTGNEHLHALANWDPVAKAMVMARGLVGSKGDIPFVASPIYKQRYDLRTGQGIDDAAVKLSAYPVRVTDDGVVHVASG